MSAEENLNPQQFFHGTSSALTPGDFIEPGHPRGIGAGDPDTRPCVTTNLLHAQRYARSSAGGGDGHVYEAAPVGTVTPYPKGGRLTSNGYVPDPVTEYRAPKFRVVREVGG